MVDYVALKAELAAGHPDTGPYDADNQIAADQLNAVNRMRNRDVMDGDEIYNTSDPAEFSGLTDTNKQLWMSFCGRNSIDPFATMNVQTVIQLFGGGSATVTALQTARVEDVSRAVELGFGHVWPGDVKHAREI